MTDDLAHRARQAVEEWLRYNYPAVSFHDEDMDGSPARRQLIQRIIALLREERERAAKIAGGECNCAPYGHHAEIAAAIRTPDPIPPEGK